jgi:hypothetical protein
VGSEAIHPSKARLALHRVRSPRYWAVHALDRPGMSVPGLLHPAREHTTCVPTCANGIPTRARVLDRGAESIWRGRRGDGDPRRKEGGEQCERCQCELDKHRTRIAIANGRVRRHGKSLHASAPGSDPITVQNQNCYLNRISRYFRSSPRHRGTGVLTVRSSVGSTSAQAQLAAPGRWILGTSTRLVRHDRPVHLGRRHVVSLDPTAGLRRLTSRSV